MFALLAKLLLNYGVRWLFTIVCCWLCTLVLYTWLDRIGSRSLFDALRLSAFRYEPSLGFGPSSCRELLWPSYDFKVNW